MRRAERRNGVQRPGVAAQTVGHVLARPANLHLWSDVHSELSRYLARLDQGEGDEQVLRYAVSLGGYTEGGIAIGKGRAMERMTLDRITANPAVMGGKPCVRGTRVTVGTVVGLVAAGYDAERILAAYPYVEREDIAQALAYAAWRAEEREIDLVTT